MVLVWSSFAVGDRGPQETPFPTNCFLLLQRQAGGLTLDREWQR